MPDDSKPFQQTPNEDLHPAQPHAHRQQELLPDDPLAGLEGPDRWKAILQLAAHAGRRAEKKCKPRLLAVRRHMPPAGEPELSYMEYQGSAVVCVRVDRRLRFGRWLVQQDGWSYDECWGVYLYVGNPTHSFDKALAFAQAFVVVAQQYGISCVVAEWAD